MMSDQITPSQFEESPGAEDWRVLSDGANAFYRTDSMASAARFVHAISEIADIENHLPDIDLRPAGVTVRLITFTSDFGGLTTRDLDIARQISAAAKKLGLEADPSAIQSMIIIPGWTAPAEVMPFWRAMLGYVPRIDSPNEDLVDPHNRGTGFWFERMDEPRPDGGGAIHVGIFVPYEQAEARVAAALAAGGRMVRDQFAPQWWTLADAAGNEADIATTKGRD
jgi:4a-hydroxytetrahydrobiopterin dehydratase